MSVGAPLDRLRFVQSWASGLTPEILGSLFDAADQGELGPLNELSDEIRGKDSLVSGLVGDRLAQVSEGEIVCQPSPLDPDPGRAGAVCLYVEETLAQLALYKSEHHGGESCPVKVGDLPHVLQALSLPFWHGLGLYWPVYQRVLGEPVPRIVGVEHLDPARYRSARPGSSRLDEGIFLETADDWSGRPLGSFDPMRIFALRSGVSLRYALAGVGRRVAFWFWLRTSGAFSMARLLEKFGVPNVILKRGYPEGNEGGVFSQADLQALQLFAESYQSDVAAYIPRGFEAEVVSLTQGSENLARAILDLSKQSISYAITGQEVVGSASAPGGSVGVAGGAASSAERIVGRLAAEDRRLAVSGLTEIARRAVTLRWGQSTPLPTIKIVEQGAASSGRAASTQTAPTREAQGGPLGSR